MTEHARAVETLIAVIAQLRENGYHDWPDLLERDVLPALDPWAEPLPRSEVVIERLDRPGNRANGTRQSTIQPT